MLGPRHRARDLPAEAVEALLAEAGPGSGSPLALVELRLLGGAISRPPRVPSAVTGRDAAFSVYALGVLAGPSAELVAARAAAVVDALEPWARGGLVNLLGPAGPERVGRLLDDRDRARLHEVKRRYDPAGTFSSNVVIG